MFSSTLFFLQMWTQSYTIGNALGSARSQGVQKQSRMSWILKTEQDFNGKGRVSRGGEIYNKRVVSSLVWTLWWTFYILT